MNCLLAYLASLLTFFLTCLLPYLSTLLRTGSFCFQAGGHKRKQNPAVVFLCVYFCVIVYIFAYACLLLL